MPSNLRKRKVPWDTAELPSSVSNPKPEPSENSHVALNRQAPTIVPTVFIFLILGLLLALPPIFYYTQVMIPDPDSTSTLSQFRIKGNILLNALGHTSSSGRGRPQFSPLTHPTHTKSANQKQNKKNIVDSTEELEKLTRLDDSNSRGSPVASKPAVSVVSLHEEMKIEIKEEAKEKQVKLDEELGKFWEASSRYRKEAQKQKSGEYSLQGDGTVKSQTSNLEEELLKDLPPADPDAKEGLTPEFWEAIKDQLSADDLTVVLNQMRLKEQAITQS